MSQPRLQDTELATAVSRSYEAGTYASAILDAMHFLSDLLRDKSGAEGDGAALVGQALGGERPRLRVNRLQTETERNIQKGIENLTRGLYQAIRNPRSHERIEDSRADADAIILFIDYLVRVLRGAQEPFILDRFLVRCFDEDFVPSERYASLLVAEIPSGKRLDVLIEIFRRSSEVRGAYITLVTGTLLGLLSDDEIQRFAAVASENLVSAQEPDEIKDCLELIPPVFWPKISEIARIRIEHKLLGALRRGLELGYLTKKYIPVMVLQSQLKDALLAIMETGTARDRIRPISEFLEFMPDLLTDASDRQRCVSAVSMLVRRRAGRVFEDLLGRIRQFPEEWQAAFEAELRDATDPNNPAIYLSNGQPFLTLPPDADDIPF